MKQIYIIFFLVIILSSSCFAFWPFDSRKVFITNEIISSSTSSRLCSCINGTNGIDGINGTNGIDGINGTNGLNGNNFTYSDWFNQSLNKTSNVQFNNLHIDGNFSAKRSYWNGYDNSTQNFKNTSEAQIVNLSNNNDYDMYMIHIKNSQNITFEQTGDYLIVFSPEFYQASGTNKIITFWIRKNGVDVPWSNSRYTINNGDYFAPSINYQVDIEHPATDYIQIMWYSDSTATSIISVSGLTNPTRPSIPGVLLNIQKVSEITP